MKHRKQRRFKAIRDYEEASACVLHWNNDIAKAIKHYFDDRPSTITLCLYFIVGVIVGSLFSLLITL